MCCRYYYDQKKTDMALEDLKVRHLFRSPSSEIITPGKEALMVAGGRDGLSASSAVWGFPGKQGQLVINARCESAAQRPMFSASLEARRCLLPAECFYEWDAEKNMAVFSAMNGSLIFLAGLWTVYDDVTRFVVLTTEANESMASVHDRMPLMVSYDDIGRWITDTTFALAYLKAQMPLLRVKREYEQMRLF